MEETRVIFCKEGNSRLICRNNNHERFSSLKRKSMYLLAEVTSASLESLCQRVEAVSKGCQEETCRNIDRKLFVLSGSHSSTFVRIVNG